MVGLKQTALSCLLVASSCANLVHGATVGRLEYRSPVSVAERDAEFQTLTPMSAEDFPGLAKRGDGSEDRAFTPITGAVAGIVSRMPIGQLRGQEPDTFNLLVLAWDRLMHWEEDQPLSWFKLAGIHGLPFEPWQYPPEATVNDGLGYCTHSSSIFLTWHRPYLLLIEQLLWTEAKDIANGFSGADRTKYLAAADRVRIPYWDWSATGTQSRIPDALKETEIDVVKPSGPERIINPFNGYTFLNGPPAGSGMGPRTARGPNDDKLVETYPGRRQSTLDMFSRAQFNPASEQLEGIHGGVHVFIGGDMPIVPRSSFDPIFWLHHCNVDRLTAMYQATRPGVALSPRRRSPTFALGGEGPDDLNTRLFPFRHPNGAEWTSNDVSSAGSIHQYGYSYPEVPSGMAEDALRAFTIQKVNEAYGPNTNSKDSGFSNVESRDLISALVSRVEWDCVLEYDVSELSGPSYQIMVYLSPLLSFDADQSAENLAGAAAIFAGGMTSPMDMPQKKISTIVPLTPKLLEHNLDLDPLNIAPLLTNQLSWAVLKVCEDTGELTPVPVDSIKSLKVSVVSSTAEYSTDLSELPKKFGETLHADPTDGKIGGFSIGDDIPEIIEQISDTVVDIVGGILDILD